MNECIINIETIKRLVSEKKIIWRNHILVRMQQRGIKINDVIECVMSGKIIEYYYDDYPYPSCLILGCINEETCLHVVCAVGENKVWMITAYTPDKEEWYDDLKTRRE
ncbi:MAG: hypothetical protein JG764_1915 [Clostridiales bacterium]|nr:hypothetical protein [Clostridiales bacterium]